MGEWKNSINHYYSRKDLITLYRIAEDTTVDEEDRELARELIEKLEREDEEIDTEEKVKDE